MFRPDWRCSTRPDLQRLAGLMLTQVFWFNPPQLVAACADVVGIAKETDRESPQATPHAIVALTIAFHIVLSSTFNSDFSGLSVIAFAAHPSSSAGNQLSSPRSLPLLSLPSPSLLSSRNQASPSSGPPGAIAP